MRMGEGTQGGGEIDESEGLEEDIKVCKNEYWNGHSRRGMRMQKGTQGREIDDSEGLYRGRKK